MLNYLLALVCPPAAVVRCRGVVAAALALGLWALGLASIRYGVGFVLLFACILWAFRVVGDSRAAAVTARFVRSVPPLRPGQW